MPLKLIKERQKILAGWDKLRATFPPLHPNHVAIMRMIYFAGASDMLTILHQAATDNEQGIIEAVEEELDQFEEDTSLLAMPDEGHA